MSGDNSFDRSTPVTAAERDAWLQRFPGWLVEEQHHLVRHFHFPDFQTALKHLQKIADLAEELDHHPDLELRWGFVGIKLWTHSAGGLTEVDFELAGRIEQLG